MQNQLDKVQVSANRFQAEKEDFQMDAERNREKVDKLQVSLKKNISHFAFVVLSVPCPDFVKL